MLKIKFLIAITIGILFLGILVVGYIDFGISFTFIATVEEPFRAFFKRQLDWVYLGIRRLLVKPLGAVSLLSPLETSSFIRRLLVKPLGAVTLFEVSWLSALELSLC